MYFRLMCATPGFHYICTHTCAHMYMHACAHTCPCLYVFALMSVHVCVQALPICHLLREERPRRVGTLSCLLGRGPSGWPCALAASGPLPPAAQRGACSGDHSRPRPPGDPPMPLRQEGFHLQGPGPRTESLGVGQSPPRRLCEGGARTVTAARSALAGRRGLEASQPQERGAGAGRAAVALAREGYLNAPLERD